MYAIEWPFLALEYDREEAQGRVRSRLLPLLEARAGFRGLLVLVRCGIELTRYDQHTDKRLHFDCCQVRCLALWDGEPEMLRSEEELTVPLRAELGTIVLQPDLTRRYRVVYQALPEESKEVPVYATILDVPVRLEDLQEAIRKTTTSVVPALTGEPGSRGVLVLMDHGDSAATQVGRAAPDTESEPALFEKPLPGSPVRAYQHWCVSLWETQRHMQQADELALRSALDELSSLIPRGWRVNRSNYEGAFLR